MARGYRVVITDVDASGVAAAADRLGVTGIAADARSAEDHRGVAAAAAGIGRLAVWVNNAGVARAGKAWEQGDDDVRLVVDTNLVGMIHGCRVAVEAMRGSGGHVVNIASMSGLGPVPGLAVYAATKAGIVSFTTSLQGDLDRAGVPVRVHALCPHAADTDLVRGARSEPDSAILFTQRALLGADAVADAAVGLLDGRRIVALDAAALGRAVADRGGPAGDRPAGTRRDARAGRPPSPLGRLIPVPQGRTGVAAAGAG